MTAHAAHGLCEDDHGKKMLLPKLRYAMFCLNKAVREKFKIEVHRMSPFYFAVIYIKKTNLINFKNTL